MFLSDICSDLKSTCERFYEQVTITLTNRSPSLNSTTSHQQSRGQYEKIPREENVARRRKEETMDREMAQELVDLAVNGIVEQQQPLATNNTKTKRPGGETFALPQLQQSSSKSVASENLKEVVVINPEVQLQDEYLKFCREMENRTFMRLRLIQDTESALSLMNDGELIYLIDNTWFQEWLGFLRGGKRPGPIINANLSRFEGEWGQTYVGLDSKGWGVLSDLYKYDVEVIKDDHHRL
jgi:hypothetical protein